MAAKYQRTYPFLVASKRSAGRSSFKMECFQRPGTVPYGIPRNSSIAVGAIVETFPTTVRAGLSEITTSTAESMIIKGW